MLPVRCDITQGCDQRTPFTPGWHPKYWIPEPPARSGLHATNTRSTNTRGAGSGHFLE